MFDVKAMMDVDLKTVISFKSTNWFTFIYFYRDAVVNTENFSPPVVLNFNRRGS